jgi:hypothetical protein
MVLGTTRQAACALAAGLCRSQPAVTQSSPSQQSQSASQNKSVSCCHWQLSDFTAGDGGIGLPQPHFQSLHPAEIS